MPLMAGRDLIVRAEPGFSLPAFERIAPAPPPDLIGANIEAASAPGDVILDLNGRGGWVARSAIDHQRRAVTLESSPLTRLLAEIVLNPPDIRHLDAAFGAIATAPRQQSSLKASIGELFGARCPRCGRSVVVDEYIWEGPRETEPDASPRMLRKHYRCLTCREQVGGRDQRHAPADDSDRARAELVDARGPAWRAVRERFPSLDGDYTLADQLLGLYSARQLVGLHAILERIDADLRAAPVEAALRLSLLHALLPASRLNGFPGRIASVRVVGGRLRPPSSSQWRERNPWLAFEDGWRVVRTFIQRLDDSALGPVQARLGGDIRSLAEGASTAVLRLATASGLRALSAEGAALQRMPGRPHVRLILGQPPLRPTLERLSYAYLTTSWILGRDAASLLPLDALSASSGRAPWSWQVAALRRGLTAAEPLLGPESRAILLVEAGGPEALMAAVLGGAGAGYRLLSARLAEPGEEHGGTVELVPPGATLPSGPRTRANVALPPIPGGAGDPDLVPGRGLFTPPERVDQRPFSAADVALTVSDTAVAVLQTRGEPARLEHLLGEILVGLDRAGQLRGLVALDRDVGAPEPEDSSDPAGEGVLAAARRRAREPLPLPSGEQVEVLAGLIRAELSRSDHRRLREIEPGRWWLASREDLAAAAPPLADRVEWAVFSLLSTAGRLSEDAFFERIAHLFTGYDLPDEKLVRACLDSYLSRASTVDDLQTGDDLLRRSTEHSELIALLTDLGHRLGMSVWIGRREQDHRVAGRPLAAWLDEREQRAYLPLIARAPADELEQVDCIWYARNRAVLMFEVEWTAMLAEPVLRRHARIPPADELIRFLVIAPERTELVRHKLERSPLLRDSLAAGNWHILKSNHVRALAARESPSLTDLEPYLGLDPPADAMGEQIPLFE